MSLVSEPTARKVSPIFFVLAALCFLLPFAGVSCNTSAAKSALAPFTSGSGGAQADATNKCLDALNNVNLVTYTGTNLVLGTAPSTKQSADLPGDCATLNSSGSPTSSSNNLDADKMKLD